MKKFRIYIDPENDVVVYKNSIVANPAHEIASYAFSKDAIQYEFDDVKQNIVGVAIVPNKPIYRNHPEIGEHEVVFFREDIEQMAYTYGAKGYWNELTFDHDDSKPVKSAVMYMSYIIDRKNGFEAPERFSDHPDGTWLLGYHFKDVEEYNYAKENFTGWSVEGDFYLEEINQNKFNMEKTIMQKIGQLLTATFSEEAAEETTAKFENANLADGTVVQWEGELALGTPLFVVLEDGEAIPAPDGEHTLEDGRVIVTAEGIVEAIVEAAVEEQATEETTEEMEVTPEEQTAIVTEVMQIIEPRLAAIEAAIAGMGEFAKVEQVKKVSNEMAAIVEETAARVAKLEVAPAAEPQKKKFARTETNPRLKAMMEQIKGN